MTESGKPYAPERYKRIVQECFLISKNMNTSYADILKTTPREREYLIEFLLEDYQAKEKAIEESTKTLQNTKK